MTAVRIFVNQLGYLTDGPKGATVAWDGAEPLAWRLLAADPNAVPLHTDTGTFSVAGIGAEAGFDLSAYGIGVDEDRPMLPPMLEEFDTVVAEGLSEPRGWIPTAGFAVHTIDFSDVATAGEYLLIVEPDGGGSAAGRSGTAGRAAANGRPSSNERTPRDGRGRSASVRPASVRIRIGDRIYDEVLADALRMFTLQRSGYEFGPDVAGPAYARRAGHVDVAPNQGDGAVRPLPAGGATTPEGIDLYEGWTGDYEVDGRGGWYDAGDCGKYVVNGGIAVAQLLSIVERALVMGHDLAPGTAPRAALEEALWELDWMARMQVAPGLPFAGLVHHKLADEHWTPIPTLPADDPERRFVHRPSTAATLNFAAVAAQAARVLRRCHGPELRELADEYLAAAQHAYQAAKTQPTLLAPATNVLENPGSGPYNDTDLEDEWYWALGCLFLTTGDQGVLEELRQNAYHIGGTRSPWSEVGFDWRDTAAWARMQLAINPLPQNAAPQNRANLHQELRTMADGLIERAGPFGQLYSPADDRYAWGSNGMIANNAAIVAAAYYESGDEQYRTAALAGLDYLFGRNALGLSYVTGYGWNYVQNQHSRWYAAAKDPALPHPPPGTLSGGPNSDCPDPASAHLAGQPAQLCFVDDIDSWGTNEMTINWNAALAWLLAFAASV